MKYREFLERTQFTKEELIAFAYGRLVEDPPAEFSRLPAPPFLMVDRILDIGKRGNKGNMVAEKDVPMSFQWRPGATRLLGSRRSLAITGILLCLLWQRGQRTRSRLQGSEF